jgi:ATP-binding cassette subfamily F protein 3
MIVGNLEPTEGQIQLGHQVKIGYFAQNQTILLDPEKTVFQTIDDIAVGEVRPKIRTILGSFLFGSDAIDKKVKVLSGGEKTRLALAKLLLTPVNLLILDEPTNHLDMISKDVLKNALLQYTGSLIIVSHDRDFLQGLTQKVFEFKSQTIKEFEGDIYDFLDEKKMQLLQSSGVKNDANNVNNVEISNTKTEWERKKSHDAELRKLNQKIAQTEKKIDTLHEELKQIEEKISSGETHLSEIASGELYQLYEKCKKEIEKEEDLWAELVERLENI